MRHSGIFPIAFVVYGFTGITGSALAGNGPLVGSGPLARDAGLTLLEGFQCETKGDQTQAMIASLSNVKSIVGSINEKETACKALASQISTIPDIEKIVNRVNSDAAADSIRTQENTITEAIQDLNYIHSLPADSPERALYPSEISLEGSVASARAQLETLRAALGIAEANDRRQRYISGLQDLIGIANQLSEALAKNTDCFKQDPRLRQTVFGGLLGVAGYFIQSPLGVATNFAGRLFQNLFNISDASKHRAQDAFDAVDRDNMVIGIGCALETMGKQHCRILKGEELLTSVNAENQCVQKNVSFTDINSVLRTQEQVTEALNRIAGWSSNTTSASGDASDRQIRQRTWDTFSQPMNQTRSALNDAEIAIKQNLNPDTKDKTTKDSTKNALRGFMSTVGGAGKNDDIGDVGGSYSTRGVDLSKLFTDDDRKYTFLKLIFPDSENIQADYTALVSAYTAAIKEAYPGENRTPPLNSFSLFNYLDSQNSTPSDIATRISKRLQDPSTIFSIRSRLTSIEQKIQSLTAQTLSPEQVDKLMTDYFLGATGSVNSPTQNLALLSKTLHQIPKDFIEKYGNRSGLNNLITGVDAMIEKEKTVNSDNATPDQKVDFMRSMTGLIGKNQELFTKTGNLFRWLQNYAAPSATGMKAMFALNAETLQATLGYSQNPSNKMADFANARMQSSTQLEGFGRFAEPYLKEAVQFLQDLKNGKGRYSQGLRENFKDRNRDQFCIQLLAMTEISQEVKELCTGAKIKSGNTTINFDDFKSLSHPKRSCAYYNFLMRERGDQESHLGRPPAPK